MEVVVSTGKLIVFDGGEGAGKGTQIKRAKEYFGDRAIMTREPGGSPNAEKIREFIFSEEGKKLSLRQQFDYMWKARSFHVKETIIPALNDGKIVLCDRFASSTYAYQVCAEDGGKELELSFWGKYGNLLQKVNPDCYIFLDIDPVKGLMRKGKQPASELNYFDGKPLEYHQSVYLGFKKFMLRKKVKGKFVNADQSPDAVWHDLSLILKKY